MDKLWYTKAAENFSEALPIGNGSLGAMVYGGFPDFKYSLNLDTLWSGKPGENGLKTEEKVLSEIRKKISSGQLKEANDLTQQYMTGERYNESYVNAGSLSLHINFPDLHEPEYKRELYLNTAVSSCSIKDQDNLINVKTYASCADDLLITEVTSSCRLEFSYTTDSLLKCREYEEQGYAGVCGEAPSHVEPNYAYSENPVTYGSGMAFAIISKVILCEKQKDAGMHLVLATAVTDGFKGFDQNPETDKKSVVEEAIRKIKKAEKIRTKELFQRHLKIYQNIYNRVELNLFEDIDRENRPTDVRIKDLKENKTQDDKGLYSLLFQYGRYLMICSSRNNTQDSQPANLQGIWCEEIRPAWSCNFTVNINTEMNYWMAGPAALPECEIPLIRMVTEISRTGKETAKNVLHTRGWAANHNIDIWRMTDPVKGDAKWAFWPYGGVWLSIHLYNHFLYTGDLKYAKETVLPVINGSVQFLMDWLEEKSGVLHSMPSTSPENTFLDKKGDELSVSDSSTMDMTLARELLESALQLMDALDCRDEQYEQIKKMLTLLPEFHIGRFGQLMEWSQDYKEADPNHRHFAHLVGLHPFHQISHVKRENLLPAVETTIKRRLDGTNIFIGWEEAWLVNFMARLYKGNEAEKHLKLFLKHCAYPNLFSIHPPLTENDLAVFQIDGNFGLVAGIMELLLQSHDHIAYLLPALPSSWTKGYLKGAVIEGGHIVSLRWNDGQLQEAEITFSRNDILKVQCENCFIATCDNQVIQAVKEKTKYFLKIQGKTKSNWIVKPN